MPTSSPITFNLLDGTSIPWLGWGNGAGGALDAPIETGRLALQAGIRHIDTAQLYGTEEATGQTVAFGASLSPPISKEEIYVTTKLGRSPDGAVPLDQARTKIEESIKKLGFIPDLFLIHTPDTAPPGQLKSLWKIFEELKSEGKLKSIGVSNFKVEDLEAILDGAKYKPVVNQIEFTPHTIEYYKPVISLQAKHGILTQSYAPLSPLFRYPGGESPIKPILDRIANRLSKYTGEFFDAAAVLLLWNRTQGALVVTSSGNAERINLLGRVSRTPDLLEASEIAEITRAGKTQHFRYYTS